jgi:hypothetical protein
VQLVVAGKDGRQAGDAFLYCIRPSNDLVHAVESMVARDATKWFNLHFSLFKPEIE